MREIPLTRGKVALVDNEDFERLNQFKWFAQKSHNDTWYAKRAAPRGERGARLMHHEIMGAGRMDHRDGNGCNNQRDNLRPATAQQNGGNRRKSYLRPTSSRFKGVCWIGRLKKWRADIRVAGVRLYLGVFITEEDAARAYDVAAAKAFGDFAKPNLI